MNLYEGQMYWDQTVVNPLRFEKLGAGAKTQVLIVGGRYNRQPVRLCLG